jgi:hypothetical protein
MTKRDVFNGLSDAVRHNGRPFEIVREWTPEEIAECGGFDEVGQLYTVRFTSNDEEIQAFREEIFEAE